MVDVVALGAEIQTVASDAKEQSPAALRERIRQLETQLKGMGLEARLQSAWEEGRQEGAADALEALERVRDLVDAEIGALLPQEDKPALPSLPSVPSISSPADRPAPAPARRSRRLAEQSPDVPGLGKAERRILTALAQFGSSSKAKVAAIAGYAIGGGGFNNSLGSLRTKGAIERGEPRSSLGRSSRFRSGGS